MFILFEVRAGDVIEDGVVCGCCDGSGGVEDMVCDAAGRCGDAEDAVDGVGVGRSGGWGRLHCRGRRAWWWWVGWVDVSGGYRGHVSERDWAG